MFRFIHGHNLFLKPLTLPSTSLYRLKWLKHFNGCTHSKNELFLQRAAKQSRNAFSNP